MQIRQDKEDRIQIKSNWVEWYYYTVVQFYMVSKTWLTPELLHASGVVLPEALDDVIFRYHSFYSFCLLSFGLMFFVLSLEEGFYAYQFKQFGWSLLNIAMIVLAGHGFLIGLWRIRVWWAYTLACLCFRDIVDNVVSKIDPVRIPLHSLSPQHTLFGFLVSATAAFTFYFTVSSLSSLKAYSRLLTKSCRQTGSASAPPSSLLRPSTALQRQSTSHPTSTSHR